MIEFRIWPNEPEIFRLGEESAHARHGNAPPGRRRPEPAAPQGRRLNPTRAPCTAMVWSEDSSASSDSDDDPFSHLVGASSRSSHIQRSTGWKPAKQLAREEQRARSPPPQPSFVYTAPQPAVPKTPVSVYAQQQRPAAATTQPRSGGAGQKKGVSFGPRRTALGPFV